MAISSILPAPSTRKVDLRLQPIQSRPVDAKNRPITSGTGAMS